ncbi:hypothetical protein [Urechidicola croceus]|uniref:TonB C-terminal domain-containing protein n=1 Tax=Urechidicola croceus TaxID=1850246 RepID=A0A1D8PAV8_9FLAO|nr:hypothetical protein [Urechidicola croceus]AOW21696.1 hypothetical protein LPB138_13840 [Urechidicola croceus]
MLKRILIICCCGIFLSSCEFFRKKEIPLESVVDTIIDYKSVDVFPLFPSCDSIPNQQDQKLCSQIKLSQHIYASLLSNEIMTTRRINDTILVKLNIDISGKVRLVSIKSSDLINKQIPKLDSLIEKGIEELPYLKPAIKRDFPVITEFTLPIIVKS